MKIINHRLYNEDNTPVLYKDSPNKNTKKNNLKYIVLHWTANTSFNGAINTLTSTEKQVSAHLVLGRDGKLAQLVPFNQVAFHVGTSEYLGLTSLNSYTIGIEVCCFGGLTKKGNNYLSWTDVVVPQNEIFFDTDGKAYQDYSPEQYATLQKLIPILQAQYPSIEDIVSHKMLAMPRGRKTDIPAKMLEKVKSSLHPK